MSIRYIMLAVPINMDARNSINRFLLVMIGSEGCSVSMEMRLWRIAGKKTNTISNATKYIAAALLYMDVKPYFTANVNDRGGPMTQARESWARNIPLKTTTLPPVRSVYSLDAANICGMAAELNAEKKMPTLKSIQYWREKAKVMQLPIPIKQQNRMILRLIPFLSEYCANKKLTAMPAMALTE